MNLTSETGKRGMDARPNGMIASDRRPYRLVTYLTLFALLFAGFFAIPTAVGASSDHTTDDVNFRIGPGTDYDAMTVIPTGTEIEVIGEPVNGFYPVRYGDATGYVSTDYVSVGGGSGSDDSGSGSDISYDGATGPAWVIDGALNLRSGPGTSNPVITVMPGDAQVELTGEVSNGFLGVVYNGTSGWAFADYLSQNGAPAPEPTQVPETPLPTEIPETPVPTEVPVTPEPTEEPAGNDIVSIIYAAADRYGQPREDMLRVATCESNLDPTEVHPVSQASGLFQFLPSTWATTPYADQDIFDPVANANAAGWMWSVGRRNEWVCQ